MGKAKTLGEIFKEARLKKGLTQIEVGEKAGLGQNSYPKIERGEQKPKFKNIKSIAKILGIDLNSLPD